MKYDFIEVGTSNFSTLIENANDYTKGISVEPISYYLNQLPNKPGVIKLNCAISRNNEEETLNVYYIPEDVIDANDNIPDFIKGCNAVGDYHKQHEWLDVKHLVKIEPIPCIPISKLFIDYNVTECDYLKLDTEGSDSDILLYFLNYLKTQDVKSYPKRITFESNVLTPKEKVEEVLNAYLNIGYEIEHFYYPWDESTIVYKLK